MPEDPRILTRKRFLFLSGCLPWGEISLHDAAQRERIDKLEDRVRELEAAPGELEVWLCPPHRALDDARKLEPLGNCVACIRAQRNELEAGNRRLRDLLKEFHELAKHLRIYTAGYRSRVEAALQPAAPQPAPDAQLSGNSGEIAK